METLLLIAAVCGYNVPCYTPPPPPDPPAVVNYETEIQLRVTVLNPGRMPDADRYVHVDTIKQCWELAEAFAQPDDIGKALPQSIGLAAACVITKKPSVPQ